MSDTSDSGTDPVETLFAPLGDADWPPDVADLREGFAGRLNVYRVMAHHPALLSAWSALREHIVNQTTLGPERAEVVILRVGHRLGAPYEWSQHILRARRLGFDDARIAALGGALAGIAPRDRLLADARLPEALVHRLVAEIGRKGVIDLMATVGFYSTLGFLLNTAKTPLDDDASAELAHHPFAPEQGA